MIDRIAPTKRPNGPPQGYHKWRTLLFLHWEVPVAALRELVPPRLEIDTHEGRAYVGLVPFTMTGIRPTRFVPPLPGVSSFHETNVRTYVTHVGKDPGVFFFSLDAANTLAVKAARTFWHLPYFRAQMQLEPAGDFVRYRSARLWPPPTPAALELSYRIGAPVGPSEPGTLQFWLVERYFLYSVKRDGSIFRGQVHHSPYPLREAHVEHLDESLIRAAGLSRDDTRDVPDLYSEGVDVEVFPLVRV